jgi:hypothetical protein
MYRNRLAVAALLGVSMFPLSALAANPTNLTWTPASESERRSSCQLSSAGALNGSLAFKVGATFGCGVETVIRPGAVSTVAGSFGVGSHAFAVLQDYDLSEEVRFAAGVNEACDTYIAFDYSTVRPWTVRHYANCWGAPYNVYEISLGTPRVVATCEANSCRRGEFGDTESGLDEPLVAQNLGIVFVDRRIDPLATGSVGNDDFMIALRNRVATEAVIGQAAAIWRETDGKLFYLSAEDLAKIPATACGDGGGIGDPRLKKPVAGEVANSADIKVSWGQVKKNWSDQK